MVLGGSEGGGQGERMGLGRGLGRQNVHLPPDRMTTHMSNRLPLPRSQ